MIHKIYSSDPRFKTLSLRPGLNVILADTTRPSEKQATRNRAGKSSIIEVANFVLGSSVRKSDLFKLPELKDQSFGMVFDAGESLVTATRRGETPAEVIVESADMDSWPLKMNRALDDIYSLRVGAWTSLLGSLMFSMPFTRGGLTHGPTFRMALPYFLRIARVGGLSLPEATSSDQQVWQRQVSLTYMLGLDWSIPQACQGVREQEKLLATLRSKTGKGALPFLGGKVSELRTKLAVSEDRLAELRRQLATFQVHPQYHELEREASSLTEKISRLANENTINHRVVNRISNSLRNEAPPSDERVLNMYQEAAAAMPERVTKRLEDVRRFHRSVTANRVAHLSSELDLTKRRVIEVDESIRVLSDRRAVVMMVLSSHGALDHFSDLQTELGHLESDVQTVRQQLDAARLLESKTTQLEIRRGELQRDLQQNFSDEAQLVDEAIVTFSRLSNRLYESPGSLHITATDNGPQIGVDIEGMRSEGIRHMQIFCFDLMLLELMSRRNSGPGFLIHDSHIFDGVDSRQRATAIQLGAEKSESLGFQYIVTMNSDDVPYGSFDEDFDFDSHVLDIRLTDEDEAGGLFGFRFG